MAVLSAMLLMQGVGPLRDERMEVLGLFIRLVMVFSLLRDSPGFAWHALWAVRLTESSWP